MTHHRLLYSLRSRHFNGSYWNHAIPSLWPERRPIIDIHDLLILDMHNQIGFAVAVDVADLAGDGGEILAVAEEDRSHVDVGMRYVAAGDLDDLDVAVQVEKDKVRWIGRAIAVTHYRVQLRGAWATVAQIVLVDVPP